ncbi:MAG: hypothetical protein ACTSQY_05185 [Candidatus Odinarchaeia archaeon]
MTKGKVKIEFFNQEVGSKITLIIEGGLPQTIVDPLQKFLMNTIQQPKIEATEEEATEFNTLDLESLTKKQKIELIIIKYFRNGTFSSKDIQEMFRNVYNEEIILSTISTNLSRLVDEGILLRSGPRLNRRYKLYSNIAKKKLKMLYPFITRLKL